MMVCALTKVIILYVPIYLAQYLLKNSSYSCLAEPEPPIQLQRMEETTNQIGLALERKEEEEGPGRFSTAGFCL